jgi:hypothetical protein
MRNMRFFHPMVRPRELSRVNLGTLCAHRACLTYGLLATGRRRSTGGLPSDENAIVVGVWMLEPGEA